MKAEKNVHYGTGRRKTATARVFLRPGTGKITINGRDMDEYFPRPVARMVVRQPLRLAEVEGHLDVVSTVKGGGAFGQAQAVRHGLARALLKRDELCAAALRSERLLTRDPRKVERKKVGLHKARKAPQFSKR